MKRLTILGLFLGFAIFAFGQSIEDKQAVIQMSIDFDDLQQYYRADKIEGRSPLVIHSNDVVPPNLKITKFGEPVQFMTKNELFFNGKEAFLDFGRFEISEAMAEVEFQYKIEGLIIKLIFEKVDGKWTIKNHELKEL